MDPRARQELQAAFGSSSSSALSLQDESPSFQLDDGTNASSALADHGEQDVGQEEPKDVNLHASLLQAISAGNEPELVRILDACRQQLSSGSWKGGMQTFLDRVDPQDGSTALIQACRLGHMSLCYLLLQAGASADIPDKQGWTALEWATNYGHTQVSKLLQDSGAKPFEYNQAAFVTGLQDAAKKTLPTVEDFKSSAATAATIANVAYSVGIPETLSNHPFPGYFCIAYLMPVASNHGTNRTTIGGGASIAMESSFYKSGFDFHGLDEELYNTVGMGLGTGLGTAATTAGFPGFGILEKLSETLQQQLSPSSSHPSPSSGDFRGEEGETTRTDGPFVWDRCLSHQMLVCDARQVQQILQALTDQLTLPHGTRSSRVQKLVLANTIFLCTRYAHHYGGPDLMEALLGELCSRLERLTRIKAQDMTYTAFYLANLVYLYYYLHRDPAVKESTTPYRERLAALVESVFLLFVENAKQRSEKVLVASMLEFESIPGGEEIEYESKKVSASRRRKTSRGSEKVLPSSSSNTAVFFRGVSQSDLGGGADASANSESGGGGGLLSSMNPFRQRSTSQTGSHTSGASTGPGRIGQLLNNLTTITARPPPPQSLSPRTITTILSSTLFVLQCYENPELVQAQVLSQLFSYMGTHLLNRLLDSDDSPSVYCTRWKAVCMRMNVSVLEDWIRVNTNATTTLSEPSSPLSSPGYSPRHRQLQRKGFEGLLEPLWSTHPDSINVHLGPFIAAIQLLQIATTTFGEQSELPVAGPIADGERRLRWLYLLLETTGYQKERFLLEESASSNGHSNAGDASLARLTFAQIHRLLVVNYHYEKGEDVLNAQLEDLLDHLVVLFREQARKLKKEASKSRREAEGQKTAAAAIKTNGEGWDGDLAEFPALEPTKAPTGSKESLRETSVDLVQEAMGKLCTLLMNSGEGDALEYSGDSPLLPETRWLPFAFLLPSKDTNAWVDVLVRVQVPDTILKLLNPS